MYDTVYISLQFVKEFTVNGIQAALSCLNFLCILMIKLNKALI